MRITDLDQSYSCSLIVHGGELQGRPLVHHSAGEGGATDAVGLRCVVRDGPLCRRRGGHKFVGLSDE